jgi:hypothetical protein
MQANCSHMSRQRQHTAVARTTRTHTAQHPHTATHSHYQHCTSCTLPPAATAGDRGPVGAAIARGPVTLLPPDRRPVGAASRPVSSGPVCSGPVSSRPVSRRSICSSCTHRRPVGAASGPGIIRAPAWLPAVWGPLCTTVVAGATASPPVLTRSLPAAVGTAGWCQCALHATAAGLGKQAAWN